MDPNPKADHTRLASDTERDTDCWELSQQVQTQSLKAVLGQVEAVTVRQKFVEQNLADTRHRLSAVERGHRELRDGHNSLKAEHDNLARGHEKAQQLLQASDGSLAVVLEQSALMRGDLGVLQTELQRLIDLLESVD